MNIFVLDTDPIECARLHADQHVGKMLLEACQLLCNTHTVAPYKRTHYNHPCSVWVRTSLGNYLWLCELAHALAYEWVYRFGKEHGSQHVAVWAQSHLPPITSCGMTPFVQAMPEKYRNVDVVTAYRAYYRGEKQVLRGKPATWTRREKPTWFSLDLLG